MFVGTSRHLTSGVRMSRPGGRLCHSDDEHLVTKASLARLDPSRSLDVAGTTASAAVRAVAPKAGFGPAVSSGAGGDRGAACKTRRCLRRAHCEQGERRVVSLGQRRARRAQRPTLCDVGDLAKLVAWALSSCRLLRFITSSASMSGSRDRVTQEPRQDHRRRTMAADARPQRFEAAGKQPALRPWPAARRC